MAEGSYLAWCRQHEISMLGVEPAYVAEGWRGVVATQELAPGHVVMKVPQQMLMSVLTANQDAALSTLLQQHQLSSHQILTVHLIHEASKGPASKWHPYIQQLPRTYTTFANWPPAAVQQLQVDYAQAAAAEAVCKARQEWTTARPVLQQLGVEKKWSSWRAWQWACSAVLSRTMYHPADPACGCLTPLGDLHNCAPPPPPHTPQLEQDLEQLLQQQQQQQQEQQLRRQQCSRLLLEKQQQDALNQGSEQLQWVTEGALQGYEQQLKQGTEGTPQESVQQLQHGSQGASQDTQEDTAQGVVPNSACAVANSPCDGGDVFQAAAAAAAAAAAVGDSNEPVVASQQVKLSTTHQDSPARPSAGDTASVVGVATAPQHNSTLLQRPCCGSTTTAVPEGTQRADEAMQGQQQQQQQTAEQFPVQQEKEAPQADGALGAVDSCSAGSTSICGDGHFDEAEGCYKIVARMRYKPGDQVFLCYGHHTNLELLQLYGFMLPDNPHDTASIPPSLLQQHLQRAAHSYRQRQQQQQGCEGRRMQCRRQQKVQQDEQVYVDISEADCWVHANGQPSWQLLSALRSAASCVTGCAAVAFRAQLGEAVSLASELLVLQALAGACGEQRDMLPTSLTQDAQLRQAYTTAAAATSNGCASGAKHAASKAAAAATAESVETGSEVGSTGVSCAASRECTEQTHEQSNPAVPAAVMQQQDECCSLALLWRHTYKFALCACSERCERLLAVAGTCNK